jgi:hypothetical protein
MNWHTINRRVHLYLALFLLPWFLMYGVSSIPFSHPQWGNSLYDDGVPMWTLRFEQPFSEPVPEGDLRPLGARILRDTGIEGSFGAYRQNQAQINVYIYTFLKSTQIKYFVDRQLLRVEDRRFRWDQFFTGMHARGGFAQNSALDDAWAIVVDVVCVAFLVWIVTGLIMWWQIRGHRRWGLLALGAGSAAFAVFMFAL